MSKNDPLKDYNRKRDFEKTPEPAGEVKPSKGDPIYVIQHHAATADHYDFRIEVDGVLKSWAVPKGPSTDPSDKRLAVPTEDHPMSYANFEGTIPEGEYGGGTVLLWDRGTYQNLKEDEGISMQEAYEMGRIEIWLEGEKLQGGYALIRTGGKKKQNWLLIKKNDEEADRDLEITLDEPDSVLTNRSMDEIAGADG
jgi:bifunctional non-homologous end joining protein LigD